jgi:hypothetical protein
MERLPNDVLRDRFFAKILMTDTCWIWTADTARTGYGRMYVTSNPRHGRKMELAHRLAWKLLRGSIPSGMLVLHHCDVRACVNPDHLFIGTQLDNIYDMFAKGRSHSQTARACHKGHAFSADNTIRTRFGRRVCRTCVNFNYSSYYYRKVAMGYRKVGPKWERVRVVGGESAS